MPVPPDDREPDDYLVEHIRAGLAQMSELDVQVSLAPGKIVITGNVSSAERRQAVAEAVRDLAPTGYAVDNEMTVMDFAEPSRSEWLE